MERIKIKRFPQPGKVECGPAAVCCAVSIYPNYVDRFSIEEIIEAAKISGGADVGQLAKSVEALSESELSLIFKTGGTIDDIRNLVGQNIPVVIDWQGSTFTGSDGGRGHYSVITAVNDNELQMVDSLPEFPNERTIPVQDLEKLWWDTDLVIDPAGNEKTITTNHLLFIIVPTAQASDYIQKFKMLPGKKFSTTD